LRPSPYKVYCLLSIVLFGGAFGFLWWCCRWWNLIVLYFLAINFVVGFLYFLDKIIAGKRGIVRVPELILHILALWGGSPMALLAQKLFRHKISKKSFIVIYWLIVLIQTGVLSWFFIVSN